MIRLLITIGVVLTLLLSSCCPATRTVYRNGTAPTESSYDKYKRKQLEREQLRYYRNQNYKKK